MKLEDLKQQYCDAKTAGDLFLERIAPIEKRRSDGLPSDLFESIAEPIRRETTARAIEVKANGRLDLLERVSAEHDANLSRTIQWHRTEGVLKPPATPADVIKGAAARGLFQGLAWNREPHVIAQILKLGEWFVDPECDFRHLKTNMRTFTRRDPAFDATRTVGTSAQWHMDHCCTPESTIAAAEEAERREANEAAKPFSAFSGPNAEPR